MLWLLNGLVFYVLLFATGQWRRVVPTSWDVLPNAASVALQYLSLDWPTENGWVAYNSLQILAYFVTIFIAAPLALVHRRPRRAGAQHRRGAQPQPHLRRTGLRKLDGSVDLRRDDRPS